MPRKSLEEVLDVLKDKFPVVPIHEPTQVVLNKSIVNKKGSYAKQSNSDLIFTNKKIKQVGNVIIKKLNEFQNHHKFGFIRCFLV